jgi:predicted nucleic acid-binding protein
MDAEVSSQGGEPPLVVIDSNVVLDWLLFGDASTLALEGEVRAGRLAWAASAAMLAEYRRVFKPAAAVARGVDPLAFESSWARWGRLDDASPPACGLRCTDPDDQVFIDFALARHARWLLTRDRALLKLARRARERGLAVLRPVDWRPAAGAPVHGQGALATP